MKSTPENPVKVREISFCSLHPDKNQGGTAVKLLSDCEAVHSAERLSATRIRVSYDIREATLEMVEALLQEYGLHLDNALIQRMRRALVRYTEETQRSNMGCNPRDPNCTAKVFINRYQKRDHGCQDDRPQHWQRYL